MIPPAVGDDAANRVTVTTLPASRGTMGSADGNLRSAPQPASLTAWRRLALPMLLAVAALAVFGRDFWRRVGPQPFVAPVAWTVSGDALYVLEEKHNTLLELHFNAARNRLVATRCQPIEPDDADFYYVVRALYPGPRGIVVHSYVYERGTRRLAGYRFREYTGVDALPTELLRITFPAEHDFPEFLYAAGPDGAHYLAQNLAGHRNLWRLPADGGVVADVAASSSALHELGDENDELSSWGGLAVAPDDGHLFLVSRATGQVTEYAPDGQAIGELGDVGFDLGELLAPVGASFAALAPGGPVRLTVGSPGNRSWVQFERSGAVAATLAPLSGKYPFRDILIGPVWQAGASGQPWAFDLANRAALRLGDPVVVLSSYRSQAWGPLRATALFAAGLLLAAWLLYRWTPALLRLRIPLFVKLLGTFVPLLVAVALAVGAWMKGLLRQEVEAETVRRCANLAHAAVSSLDSTDLAALRQPGDRASETYRRVYDTLARVIGNQQVPDTPKWILLKVQDGRFYFGVNIWRGALFEPFVVSPDRGREIYLQALWQKSPQHGRFQDSEGQWFSYLTPVLDATGEVRHILDLYRPAAELDRADQAVAHRLWIMVALAVLAGVALAVLFTYGVTRPLRHLAAGAELVRRGKFDGALAVRSLDEVGVLGQAFDEVRRQRQRAEDLLKVVIPIGSAMAREREFDRLLATILARAQDLCRADGGLLYLVRDGRRLEHVLLRLRSNGIVQGGADAQPLTASPLDLAERPGEAVPIAVRVVNRCAPVNLPEVGRVAESGLRLPPVLAEAAPGFRPVSWLCLPLSATDGTPIGALELVNAHEAGTLVPFDPAMQEMVAALAVLAGAALAAYLREQALRHEIRELRIVIDELKRDQDVAAIAETDYFHELARRADEMRSATP